jgi:hypothetical protein
MEDRYLEENPGCTLASSKLHPPTDSQMSFLATTLGTGKTCGNVLQKETSRITDINRKGGSYERKTKVSVPVFSAI